MFVQQLHDFDFRVGHDARLARVNVQLEQSAHTFDSVIKDRSVKRSLAFDVDRVLIDAVQRTQQLTRAREAMKSCEMQRRPTLFVFFLKGSVMKQQTFSLQQKNTSKKLTRCCFAHFQSRPKQSASAAHRGTRSKRLHVLVADFKKTTRGEI